MMVHLHCCSVKVGLDEGIICLSSEPKRGTRQDNIWTDADLSIRWPRESLSLTVTHSASLAPSAQSIIALPLDTLTGTATDPPCCLQGVSSAVNNILSLILRHSLTLHSRSILVQVALGVALSLRGR